MEINESVGENFFSRRYRLSWIAYVRVLIGHFVLLNVALFFFSFSSHQKTLAICFLVVQIIVICFVFVSVRSRYVFINERGVWFHRGMLPWTEGYIGVAWRDCGGPLYKQGFFPYIFNSYTVVITHKYTESMQIAIRDIYKGKEFCDLVGEYLYSFHSQKTESKEEI